MKSRSKAVSRGREPLTRGEKLLAFASALVVVSMAGFGVWRIWIDSEPVITYPPVAARPSPNGYDLYVAAGTAITQFNPPVDAMVDTQIVTDPKIRAGRYGLVRREAWLRSNKPAFALFRRAQSLPCVSPNQRPLDTFPFYARVRGLARAQAMAANTAKLRGNWYGAAQEGLDTMQMGIDLPQGGALLGKLVGAAITAIGRTYIEDTSDHLKAAEARAATRRLETLIARRVCFADVLEEEKWVSIAGFLRNSRGTGWRRYTGGDLGFSSEDWLRNKTMSKRAVVAQIVRSSEEAKADVKLPYSAPPPAVNSNYDFESEDLIGRYSDTYKNLTFNNMRFHEAREETGLGLFLLRLALRAYIVEHGSAPRTLAGLVPAYIKAVPTDAFADDAPFHYVPQGKGYRLWSIGPDKKNDNGLPVSRNSGGARGLTPLPPILPGSTGDWVAGKNR